MEGVPEAGLLTLLGREGLDGLQVEVVVEVEVAQALAVNEEVEHVVPLPANLESHLHPVQLRLRCVFDLIRDQLVHGCARRCFFF